MIPFLLEKGADPLKLTETELTPVQYALKNGSEEAASILAEGDNPMPDSGKYKKPVFYQ